MQAIVGAGSAAVRETGILAWPEKGAWSCCKCYNRIGFVSPPCSSEVCVTNANVHSQDVYALAGAARTS